MEERINLISEQRFMSDHINELATALCKAQAEFSVANKDKNNPFFKSKYADFEAVVNASRPALTKHNLAVIQNIYREDDGNHYLITLLVHGSGQWIKSKAQHNPVKNDIQSLSSYNTYLKRMCYASLVGVVAGEIDDDGESAMVRGINHNQLAHLKSLPAEFQDKVLNHYKIDSLAQLTEPQYSAIISKINAK